MAVDSGIDATMTSPAKSPRTERGRKTMRLLLEAAAAEFGEKGFHESSVVSITQRAGVALGSFYTYFDSKDSLFRALVKDMSGQVRDYVAPVLPGPGDQIDSEGRALAAYLEFARQHKEIYRIVDECEFVAPDAWREHYVSTAQRIVERMRAARERGEIGVEIDEVHAWAMMGINVFLGLRFGVLGEERPVKEIAEIANAMLRRGLGPS